MQLVEQHLIRKSDPRFAVIDKEFPNAFSDSFGQGIAAPAVVPRRLAV